MEYGKSYTYDDVENLVITYSEFIMSKALDIISKTQKIDRKKVGDWVLDTYGGTLEIAIIDYYRNFHC